MSEHIIKVRCTFQEEVLGTASGNAEVHSEYIASKAPDALTREEEIAAIGVEAAEEKAMTVFPKDEDGRPFLWDYQVKGFFKGSCGFLRNVPGKKSAGLKSYKKKLDGLLFIYPRRIPLRIPEGMGIGNCQRPLRAQTLQGERVALASSETVPAGTVIEFAVKAMTDEIYDVVLECLDYGADSGIGQWRNSGKGRFVWEEIDRATE